MPARMHVVVVRPPEGLQYGGGVSALHAGRRARRVGTAGRGACERGDWRRVGRHLHNRLEPAAEKLTPWIDRLRSVFDRLDCLGQQMSGSGTSYYGICRNAGHARRVAARLRGKGLVTSLVATTLATPRPTP